MDQNQSEDQIQKKFNNNKHFMKRTLQFVFPVSVFSVFVWYSSGFSIYPQFFNAYFSTCLFSMFTHTLERKYMFLICNGILAFIAKTSLSNSSVSDSDDDFDHHQIQASNLSETNAPVSDTAIFEYSSDNVPLMVEEQVKLQEEYNGEVIEVEGKEESNKNEKREESEVYTEEEGGNRMEDEEVEEESEVDEMEQDDEVEETIVTTNEADLANTEELNRKFEEFIRKMKEEIRIEAQRQLIAV